MIETCHLKELCNCILCTILVWSLFCLIQLCVSLHFLQFFWKTSIFLSVLSVFFVLNQMFLIKTLKYVSSCYVILLCKFVLYVKAQLLLIPTYSWKSFYVKKTCFQSGWFWVFLKKPHWQRKVWNSQKEKRV